MKKIRVYFNGNYLFTTEKHNTIKALKKELTENQNQTLIITSVPNKAHKIDDIKNYKFEIVKT